MRAPLSPAQERLWMLQRLEPGDASYTMYLVRRLRGPLDRDAFTVAVGALVARHESLRTAFAEEDGTPWAVAGPAGWAPPIEWLAAAGEQVGALVAERTNAAFDLAAGVPLRVAVIEVAPDDHVLCVTLHHILADGHSLEIMLDDLGEHYAAAVEGRPARLPDLPIRSSDYARWQRRRADKAMPYWTGALAAPPVTELPFARPGARAAVREGGHHWVRLGARHLAEVERLAVAHRATPFMVLMAAYQALLFRHSGQHDLVVGTVVAGRDRVELERMVGYLTQTLPLRGDLAGDPTFAELLGRVKGVVLDAMGRPAPLLERLARGVETLLPTVFIMQDYAAGQDRAYGGVRVSDFEGRHEQIVVDLLVEVWPAGEELAICFGYDGAVFEAGEVATIAERYLTLLAGAVARPDTPISRLPAWTERDEKAMAELADGPAEPVADGVLELVADVVRRTPEAVAVRCGDQVVSYAALWDQAGALAGTLRESGVREGDVVAVRLAPSAEVIAALLGVWRAGAAYLPLDPADPPARHADAMAAAGAAWLIGEDRVRAVADGSAARGPVKGIAYVMTTSGSAGLPKAVLVEHRSVAARVGWMRREYGLGPGDHVVQFASLSFDTHVEEIFPALASGATVMPLPDGPASLPDLLAGPDGHRITVLDLPTAYWHRLVESPSEVAWPPALRLVILGGEQADGAAITRWHREGPGARLVNTYGPTEATVIATWAELDGTDPGGRPPIGRPLSATSVRVLDARGEPVPPGAAGELAIGGAGVARGYAGLPRRTAAAFEPDPYGEPGARRLRTGDRARWRSDGQLEFLGRLDDQVKVRGVRIEPGDVEAALREHPGAGQVAVAARGEDLVAYFTGPAAPAELRAHAAGRLPRGFVPTRWSRLAELPLTSRGKLDRAALPEPDRVTGTDYTAPRTDSEALVAEIWAEVLGLERVGVLDDLLELGGHSLMTTRVAARLRAMLEVEVPIRVVFGCGTVAELAEAVEDLLIEEIDAMSEEDARRALTGPSGLRE
ncbi:amino acid adenylation domain-containing protein [Nonomuraea sp. NPDC003709]|uniref:non-ribosomal peptide synthetase n=1 Tax=Nonomuraea sp. NPDC003709 TaxID=3154450 RepID=UPI0033B234CF